MDDAVVDDVGDASVETAGVGGNIVGADGSLVDGWQKQAPEGYEDLREDETLARCKRLWDLSKSYVHVRKQVPLDKMPRPNDKWGQDEWNEFYKVAGRPETPEDYGDYDPPEGWDDGILPWKQVQADWQKTFHEMGLNKKQTDALVALNNKHNDIIQAAFANKAKEEQDRIHDTLRDEWGRAFDQKMFRAQKAVERGAGEDEGLLQYVLGKMQGDDRLLKWMANIEDQFSEHEPIERSNIPTPADLQEQIAEIRNDPRFMHDDRSVRQPLIDKVNRLTERLLKERQPA